MKPTPAFIASMALRLRALAEAMETLGADMDYYGGLAPWGQHGREMVNAAGMARAWADEMESTHGQAE